MENFRKSSAYPIIFMLILSFILTFLLAGLNELTLPLVKKNQELEIQEKILYVFQIEPASSSPEDIASSFNENVKVEEYDGSEMYVYDDGSGVKAYAFPFKGPGLWGTIQGFLGISSDFSQITGIEFTDQSETPGLGARIEEREYKDQYRDVDISSSDGNTFVESSPQGQIDQISGATQTSEAVIKMVNKDLKTFIETSQGGQNE